MNPIAIFVALFVIVFPLSLRRRNCNAGLPLWWVGFALCALISWFGFVWGELQHATVPQMGLTILLCATVMIFLEKGGLRKGTFYFFRKHWLLVLPPLVMLIYLTPSVLEEYSHRQLTKGEWNILAGRDAVVTVWTESTYRELYGDSIYFVQLALGDPLVISKNLLQESDLPPLIKIRSHCGGSPHFPSLIQLLLSLLPAAVVVIPKAFRFYWQLLRL
jgi:hypothetical protein